MTAPVLVHAFGRTIAIDTADSEAESRLRTQWSRCLVSSDGPAGTEPVDGKIPYFGEIGSNCGEYGVASGVTLQSIEVRGGS